MLVSHSPTLSRAERDYRAAVEVVEAPHPRIGQIGANLRGRGGKERRSEVLRWFDNEGDGRYLMSPRRHQGGQQWLVAPADAQVLVRTRPNYSRVSQPDSDPPLRDQRAFRRSSGKAAGTGCTTGCVTCCATVVTGRWNGWLRNRVHVICMHGGVTDPGRTG